MSSKRNYQTKLAFIDESGDSEMNNINLSMPVLSLCALTCDLETYAKEIIPHMTTIKYEFFGTESIVLHGHKIRQKKGEFSILKDTETNAEFMNAISMAFEKMGGHLLVAAVNKPKHKAKYSNPEPPYYLTMKFLMERLSIYWRGRLLNDERVLCIFEKRGGSEDKKTEEIFLKIRNGDNYERKTLPLELEFRPKSENIIGHQYADLAAYTACRYAESSDETRRDWLAIKNKIYGIGGTNQNCGLKIFP